MFDRSVAFITGGAAGIGLAFAHHWISEGGHAVLADLDSGSLQAALTHLPEGSARGVVCDVTDTNSVDTAIDSVLEAEGRLDTVLNSAGIARPETSADISDAAFAAMLDIHVTGSMRVCRAAHRAFAGRGGTIVNVASVAALSGMPRRASYTAAKAAIGGLTRTLAVEWGREGIRVNAIAPGYVRTALTDVLISEGKLDDRPIRARTALGRFAEPEEIASVAHFLATPSSSYVNGHTLVVDGGLTVDGNWYPETDGSRLA